MSHIIEKYEILNQLNEEFVRNIKFFYILSSRSDVLIVTKHDSVYAFGKNESGVLGLGHDKTVQDPTIITRLCNQNINNFTNCLRNVYALTSNGEVYIWGLNRGNYMIPTSLGPYINHEYIVDICSADNYSLALTKSGQVYVIGLNLDNTGQLVSKFKINAFNQNIWSMITGREKVKSISCCGENLVALTENGQVFCCGVDFSSLSENFFSKLIKMKDEEGIDLKIDKTKFGSSHCLFLTSSGDIYLYEIEHMNNYDNIFPTKDKSFEVSYHKINKYNKFIDIAVYDNSYVALSTRGYYYIMNNFEQKLEKSLFKSFNDVFACIYGITYTPIRFDINFSIESVSINTLSDGKYEEEFFEFGPIASGSYGVVCRARNINDGQIYAIKKIPFNRERDLRILEEIKIVNNLSKPYFVKCFNAWFEKLRFDKREEYIEKRVNIRNIQGSTDYLFIQMELCFYTLRQFLNKINDELNQKQNDLLTPISYYISSELFREILESIDYLHKQNLPIIHRDLKPTNILITNGMNGRFVKIADFGLATIHEFDEQSHTQGVGAMKYLAPEVLTGNYDTKADVYSLGVIAKELFNINQKSVVSDCDSLLKVLYRQLNQLIDRMMSFHKENRPNCEQIINEMSSWYLGLEFIENLIHDRTKTFKRNESLNYLFIMTKRRFNFNNLKVAKTTGQPVPLLLTHFQKCEP